MGKHSIGVATTGTHATLPLFSVSLCRRKETKPEKEHICCARGSDLFARLFRAQCGTGKGGGPGGSREGTESGKELVAVRRGRPGTVRREDDTKLKGTKGTEFFPKFCEATKTPDGVWVEYCWPKPGEKEGSRKVSYALRVSNTPYIVGAGIYDDSATITELQKLTSPGK